MPKRFLDRLFRRSLDSAGQAGPGAIVPAFRADARMTLGEAFTPTHPCTTRRGLIGREQESRAIVQHLTEDGAHVVLYSERGMGKTSVANGVVDQLRRSGVVVARYQCEASSTFDSLMRGLARTLPAALLAGPVRSDLLEGCEAAFPAAPLRPEDVIALLARLRANSLVCVIDEMDRIADPRARTLLADTIKQLSDRGIKLLFVLIGVSDSLEQLLGEHPSIERAVVGMPLSLLPDDDIAAIVERGARLAGLIFPPELVQDVVYLARGIPHTAHLLGLRTAQAAARRSTREISREDFQAAVEQLMIETPPQVVRLLDALTAGGQHAAMCCALRDVALCEQDRWGRIRVVDMSADQFLIGGRPMARACYLALYEAGVVRPSEGAAGEFIVAHRGRSLLHYLALKQTVDADRYGAQESQGGRIAAANDPASGPMQGSTAAPRQAARP